MVDIVELEKCWERVKSTQLNGIVIPRYLVEPHHPFLILTVPIGGGVKISGSIKVHLYKTTNFTV